MTTQPKLRQLNEYLIVARKRGKESVTCTVCRKEICPSAADWRLHAIQRKRVLSTVVPLVAEHPRVYLHEYICPGCGTMLDTQIVLHEKPE